MCKFSPLVTNVSSIVLKLSETHYTTVQRHAAVYAWKGGQRAMIMKGLECGLLK